VAEDSVFETIDGKLRNGDWAQWRSSSMSEPTALAAAARAWCASSHWDRNTPNLEDWRVVVEDLASEVLSEADLAEMARTSRHHIAFPPIPFFEERQVKDLLGVSDESAAILLAEQLMGLDSLLTVRPENAASICWKRVEESVGMEYAAWCWLIRPDYPAERPLPSEAGVRALLNFAGPRGAQARTLLEAAVERAGDGDARARAVMATFAELRCAAEPIATEPVLLDEPELGIATQAVVDSTATLYESLCKQLFHGPLDIGPWKALETEIEGRSNAEPMSHPVARLAQYLRGQYFPVELDSPAWENLARVLTECGGLMKVEPASGFLPLPALELAACVRSTVSIGEVAVGLVILTGEHRLDSMWWKVLWAGLQQPMARRGGWCSSNDRTGFAQDAVRAQEYWLSPREKQAFKTAIVRESNS